MDIIYLFLFFVFFLNVSILLFTIYNFRSFKYDRDLICISAVGIACNFFLTFIVINFDGIDYYIKMII